MKTVIQRVSEAKVTINSEIKGKIKNGLLVLVGIKETDDDIIMDWIINKIVNLRIFTDSDGKMNLSVKDINGGILIISNFTLYGNAKKGFRPSFVDAAKPPLSEKLYDKFINKIKNSELNIQTGEFGAKMDVSLVNDGPVTLIIEKD